MSRAVLTVEAGSRLGNSDEFCDWLRRYDVEPNFTYRVDLYLDRMRVFQYAKNAEGRKYFDHDKGEVAYRDPFEVPIRFPFEGAS